MMINIFKMRACPYSEFVKTVKENLDKLDKIYPNHSKGIELRKEFNRLIEEYNSR
jgi:glutaredoxin